MQKKIQELKQRIEQGKIPVDFKHCSEFGLVITDNPNATCDEYDTIIYTRHASAWSWLVDSMSHAFSEKIRLVGVCSFYLKVANDIRGSIREEGDILDAMLFVVERSEAFFRCKPSYSEMNSNPF
jgi:hypothetical protein